jgi:hypothetical protein
VSEFPEFIGRRVFTVKVNELLNGVDLEAQRTEQFATIANAKPIFFSYSHKDEGLGDELETHLKLPQRQGVVLLGMTGKLFLAANGTAKSIAISKGRKSFSCS